MKKRNFSFLLCLLMGLCVAFVSCEKPEPDPEQPGTEDPIVEDASIIGCWKLDNAVQVSPTNTMDLTNIYGENFYLTFMENGTLLVEDRYNQTQMQWTLDGDQLAFIQAEDEAPVMYTVKTLTIDSLSIVNGAGTDYVTTMNFVREIPITQ